MRQVIAFIISIFTVLYLRFISRLVHRCRCW